MTNRRFEAEAESKKTVYGRLSTMGLPSIVQVNCEERNEARLRLQHQGQEGTIFFADGRAVHAGLGSQVGEEAVYELLSWEDGTFELEMGVSPPERTIEVGWSGLLLEGMRRIDESTAADRSHCPECGAFVDKQGKCHNPNCSRFSGDAGCSPSALESLEGESELGLDDLQSVEDVQDDVTEEYTEVDEMANLQDILKNLASDVPGFISTDVVGMDGLSIAGYASNPDFDAEAASAQFALVMKLVSKTADQLGSGEVEDNLVTTDDAYVLTRFLGDGS